MLRSRRTDHFSNDGSRLGLVLPLQRVKRAASIADRHIRPNLERQWALPEQMHGGIQSSDTQLAEIFIWPSPTLEAVIAPQSVLEKHPCENLQSSRGPGAPDHLLEI